MIASCLAAEQDLSRMAADADLDTLAPALIGAGHLLFAGREGVPPEAGAVRKMVITVIASACKNGSPHGQPHPAIGRRSSCTPEPAGEKPPLVSSPGYREGCMT
jgi:hypothetical protein